jgi:hypothetical protein
MKIKKTPAVDYHCRGLFDFEKNSVGRANWHAIN